MKDKPQNPTSYKTYVEDAKRTDCDYEPVVGRVIRVDTLRLLHAAMGLCTESGELLDNLKKHFFYGKPIDRTNLIEEAGDLLWYVAILADVLGMKTFNEIFQRNIAKLKTRYPEKFTEEKAENRNITEERATLEK